MIEAAKNFKFAQRCLTDTLRGIREGLSLFTGHSSRVAAIFSLTENSDIYIFDPQDLLGGHAPKIRSIFTKPSNGQPPTTAATVNTILGEKDIDLDGLISFGGTAPSMFYQKWFTEHHPDICSTEPVECWLEHATQCISNDLTTRPEFYTGISGNFLREYASHAVRDSIVDLLNLSLGCDIHMRIYPILYAILGISKINEEGARPFGRIIFAEPRQILPKVTFLAQFDEDRPPLLANYKHVRKLLQAVENSEGYLVSDGEKILGICGNDIPENCLAVSFQKKIGFISYNNQTICSFAHGLYCVDAYRAKLVEVEDILLDYPLDTETRSSLLQIAEKIVHNGQDKGFGCCLVIDLHTSPIGIEGQNVHPVLDLQQPEKLQLACALSKVDGALHIRPDLKLHAFACLLDGSRIKNENRARGARYNSALRFSYHHPTSIIIVVSSDRPVSVIYQGQEVQKTPHCALTLSCMLHPQKIDKWLAEREV
ncbi:DNA integrity scanning protein DisA nucleotide-binding domain protein [Desulfotalea psychrophila]|uniref:DAC domain-containing protein n=1 Tax=Desulfotalea psychrophila (strain LSv54 / DSM 12343) TaxID=177439 RepID=Q6AML0_DESPS|nr:DNA integrity scanning protein DisA nucleotide-binding domain protein [Desulfotalea psychrophila]CAG36415.1 unknown protein [Desulfotalea psychrophila LSv54]